MITVIKRFDTYDEIALVNGQLGFCKEDETLYIGTEDGFRAVSSDEAAIDVLRQKVTQLGDDVDNIFAELDERSQKIVEFIVKAKEARDAIHDIIGDEVSRLDQRIDNIETAMKTEDSTVLPDYKNIESVNKFENATSWTTDRDGYALVTVKGLGSFELLIDNVPIISKLLSTNPNDSDMEERFTQIYQIEKDSMISLNIIQSITTITYTCHFIPYKVISISLPDV